MPRHRGQAGQVCVWGYEKTGKVAVCGMERLPLWLTSAPPGHPASLPTPTGGLQAVAELLQVDYEMHKMTRDPLNLALRRYAGMTLTNLTFGDVANKVPGWEGDGQGSGTILRCSPPNPRLE